MTVAHAMRFELEAQCAALVADFGLWRARVDANKGDLKEHHSQITELTALLEALLTSVAKPAQLEAAANTGDLATLIEVRTGLMRVHLVWDFFRDRFTQRDSKPYNQYLRIADELAWFIYESFLEHLKADDARVRLKTPPLVSYRPEWSPGALPRAAAFNPPGFRAIDARAFAEAIQRLPVPVIDMPWPTAARLPPMCLVAHEVGHVLYEDFAFGPDIEAALAAKVPVARVESWKRWASEVFCDVLGVLVLGESFVRQLASYVAAPPATLRAEKATSAFYPQTLVRMALCNRVLERCGVAEWGEWTALGMPSEGEFHADIDAVLDAILGARFPTLGDRTLGSVITWSAAEQLRVVETAAAFKNRLAPSGPFSLRIWVAAAAYAFAEWPVEFRSRDEEIATKHLPKQFSSGVRAALRPRTVSVTSSPRRTEIVDLAEALGIILQGVNP